MPRKDIPASDLKTKQHRVRLSESELGMLKYCSETTGLSKSEIVRRGIETAYNALQSQKK